MPTTLSAPGPTLLLPVVFVAVSAAPVMAQVSEAEGQIVAVENAWASAVEQGDVEALDHIIAEEYVGTTATGVVQDKDAYLVAFVSGDRRTYSLTTDDLVVSVYGSAAVVTHGGHARGELRGVPTEGDFRWSHVFIRRGDRWVAVMNHVTRMPGEADKQSPLSRRPQGPKAKDMVAL